MNKVGGGRIYFDVSVIITQSADPVVTAKLKYPRIFFQLSAQEGCDALRISGREVRSISFRTKNCLLSRVWKKLKRPCAMCPLNTHQIVNYEHVPCS